MAKGTIITDEMKEEIKSRLYFACEELWKRNGYKKTSIKELCDTVGISVGTFYTIFLTKEELFFQTMERIQFRLDEQFFNCTLTENPSKKGLETAIRDLYREYNRTPFLYDINTPDFIAFKSKLPDDKINKLQFDNVLFFKQAVSMAGVKLKVDENIAFSVLNLLLAGINFKHAISAGVDHLELFDFMLNQWMDILFE